MNEAGARLQIRPFGEADHAQTMEVWCAAWEATYPDIDFRARWPGMLERWREMALAGAVAHVACLEGQIVGLIVVDREKAVLDQIAVAPAHFGSALGKALMDAAKGLVNGRLALHVNTFNKRAIKFYEREGFIRVGEGANPRSGLPVWHYEWLAAPG